MSTYFTVPLFARAKKNQDELRKTNPQNPLLKDDDEKFLEQQIASDTGKSRTIFDTNNKDVASSDSPQSQQHQHQHQHHGTKRQQSEAMDLPSQEEAEAITHNYHLQSATRDSWKPDNASATTDSSDKRTWASYLPAMPNMPNMPNMANMPKLAGLTSTKSDDDNDKSAPTQTWSQYASSYIPAPLKPARTDADAAPTPIYNADGSLNAEATKAQQENEMGVLLAQLNASTLNNRVFALSADMQALYARFTQALRDTLAGAPTAVDDMDALMRDAGPTLDARFRALPPFVQSLVRTLPAKLGSVVGPEVLAAATAVGGSRREAGALEAGSETSGGPEATSAAAPATASGKSTKKKRRRRLVPDLRSLVGKKGALAGMLRGAVEFVEVRFPFLASTTNIVMSLAVFILMFVCWYCHKRGKEVRLAQEADADKAGSCAEDGDRSTQGEDTESGPDDEVEHTTSELDEKIEKEIDEKILKAETLGSAPSRADA